jgi:biopolymer transport protein ExbD
VIEFKEYEESLTRYSGPDMTPLIDMVFLLLIFFLLTSFLSQPSIPVDLPKSETAQMSGVPHVSVIIKRGGGLVVNEEEVTDRQLFRILSQTYALQAPKELVIQSDRGVSFGRVIEVMDIAKKAGAENMSFLVERKE